MEVMDALTQGTPLNREVWPGQQVRMPSSSKAGQACWLRGSEDIGDDVVSVNTIDQSGPIVVDEPAGHLHPMPGVLAVVFLRAPGERQVMGSPLGPSRASPPRKPAHPPDTRRKAWTNDG